MVTEVRVAAYPIEAFAGILEGEAYSRFALAMARMRDLLSDRVFWHVNSTATGGGVAEMLLSLVPYFRGLGIDCRWAVIEGSADFFAITKRLHNNLHGELGDAGDLGDEEQAVYRDTLDRSSRELVAAVRPGDVVMLHDPQTAGLSSDLKDAGATVAWRCHVGIDTPNNRALRAWSFLRAHVERADAYVFSRRAFAWHGLDEDKITVIAPSIDAFSAKNQELGAGDVEAIVRAAQLSSTSAPGDAIFTRHDGSRARVERRADLVDGGSPPPADARVVAQISRWDRLKDPLGVIEGFARFVAHRCDAHLVVAGPSVEGVADDPEGATVLDEARRLFDQLPGKIQQRVHLATLPMEDADENAAIVNALQRRATVIVQKSLAEGFGLTVAEAMWKQRPVVASRIGGIQDQIEDGVSGVLVGNPRDLATFGDAVIGLLKDEDRARKLAHNGRIRVRDQFLHPRQMTEHADLVERLTV